jgi:purine-nucleoside phosphorylase
MNFSEFTEKLKECKKYLDEKFKFKPLVGFILGTGFYSLSKELNNKKTIPYSSLPMLLENSIPGQKPEMVFGFWEGKEILMFEKRFHFYEGVTPLECTFPIWLAKELGVKYLFLFSASGGINEKLNAGDIVIIEDQINLTGQNPLREIPLEKRDPLFLNLSPIVDKELKEKIIKIAKNNNIKIETGIYAGLIGPSYETPAEINMLKKIGADIVGMSIVFEYIIARYLNLKTLALSIIANEPSYLTHLSHEVVIENIRKKIPVLKKLIGGLLKTLE